MKLTATLLSNVLIAAGHAAAETILLAQDVNYPPFAYATETGELTGFGYDVAIGVDQVCPDIDIVITETLWDNCWSSTNGGQLGALVDDGTLVRPDPFVWSSVDMWTHCTLAHKLVESKEG